MRNRDSRRSNRRGEAGFTLLEALISMSLFALILVTILMVYDSTQQTYVRGEAKADVQQNVRVAMDQIMRDIRLAGYDPSNAIALQTTTGLRYPFPPNSGTAYVYPAAPSTLSEMHLIGDVDDDGTTDCVGYRLSGGQVLRRKSNWTSGDCAWTATESAVADNISLLSFIYYPQSGTTSTTSPAQVKRVKVTITGTSTTYGTSFTMENEAALRQ